MTKLKNKIVAITISVFFILSMTISMALIPTSSAHTPPVDIKTFAYITVTPNPVGVGQYVTIVVWLDKYSPTAGGINGQHWDGFLINITQPDGSNVVIGPFTCSSDLASDFKIFTPTMVGTYTLVFSWPGEAVVNNPAIFSSADIGDYFEGATSAPAYLTVQQASISNYPETPLPTSYWTLPINDQNREWSALASNWLSGSWLVYPGYQTEGTAPTSAHILWTEPIEGTSPSSPNMYPGGIADAQYGALPYNINDYEYPWNQPIIMNGIIYQNMPTTQMSTTYGYYATDLYTGQLLWEKNGTDNGLNNPIGFLGTPGGTDYSYGQEMYQLTCGQILHINCLNGNGIVCYLWMQEANDEPAYYGVNTGTWYMLDPTTGNVILTLTHVPTVSVPTATYDDAQGDILIYQYNAATGNFLCWNSTQAIPPAGPTGTGQQTWRPPLGAVINSVDDTEWMNASTTWGTTLDPLILQALSQPLTAYTMNYTSSSLIGLPGTMKVLQNAQKEPVQFFGDDIIPTYSGTTNPDSDYIDIWLATINQTGPYSPYPTLPATLNNNLGFVVSLNYNKTIEVPLPGENYTWVLTSVNYQYNDFTLQCQQTSQIWVYNLQTGDLMWGPTATTLPMGYYDSGGGEGVVSNVYDGVWLAMDTEMYQGTLWAYNITTGQPLWSYNSTAAPYGYESAYGSNMPLQLGGAANGMFFVYSDEHSPTNPMWRQSEIRALNATTGAVVWTLEDYFGVYGHAGKGGTGLPIADGYIVSFSMYDNLQYCIGMGQSATTVQCPSTSIPGGSSFLISGTVLDKSPGSLAKGPNFGYTNGIPCVSDASMTAYMQYIYEQQPMPTNTTGVPVTITAIDPNGNTENLGTVTTNADGFYKLEVNTATLGAGAGSYNVIANFAGDDSYGASSADTAFLVNPAAAATAAPTATPASVADMYFVPAIAGIIVIIIIGFIVLALLMLRKRP